MSSDGANERPAGHEGIWISPDIFDADLKPPEWPDDPELRRAVDWLLTFLKPEEWKRRRFAALQHFLNTATGSVRDPTGKGRFFSDRDQFAWYLFLGQAFLDHPTIYDFMYGARVVPILKAIGRNLDLLRAVVGVEARVRRMIGPEKSQPNACLFELLVAAAYRRAGASVTLLEERPGVARTHDMDVLLNGTTWAVECKRMEGGEYTEEERTAVRQLWLPVARAFHGRGLDVVGTADFLVELSSVPPDYFEQKARQWLSAGALLPHKWSDAISVGELRRLNLKPLQDVLLTDDVAMNSSRMHELLLGQYRRNARVVSTLRVKWSDNPLYVDSCDAGCLFAWESRSDIAIDKRARDVLKRVADGCRQLPDGRPGIVHVAFEAVEGLDVEAVRHEKVMKSLRDFDPEGKELEYVYVSWFAPESPPDTTMAFDETCHWQGVKAKHPRPLDEGMLVLASDVPTRPGVHWKQA
jgi:hypothetical protein